MKILAGFLTAIILIGGGLLSWRTVAQWESLNALQARVEQLEKRLEEKEPDGADKDPAAPETPEPEPILPLTIESVEARIFMDGKEIDGRKPLIFENEQPGDSHDFVIRLKHLNAENELYRIGLANPHGDFIYYYGDPAMAYLGNMCKIYGIDAGEPIDRTEVFYYLQKPGASTRAAFFWSDDWTEYPEDELTLEFRICYFEETVSEPDHGIEIYDGHSLTIDGFILESYEKGSV